MRTRGAARADGHTTFEADEAVIARFADTYVGMIPVTFRFKLPADPEGVRKMHREFRSETNLVKSLLMRIVSGIKMPPGPWASSPDR